MGLPEGTRWAMRGGACKGRGRGLHGERRGLYGKEAELSSGRG